MRLIIAVQMIASLELIAFPGMTISRQNRYPHVFPNESHMRCDVSLLTVSLSSSATRGLFTVDECCSNIQHLIFRTKLKSTCHSISSITLLRLSKQYASFYLDVCSVSNIHHITTPPCWFTIYCLNMRIWFFHSAGCPRWNRSFFVDISSFCCCCVQTPELMVAPRGLLEHLEAD